MTQRSSRSHTDVRGPLADVIIALAGTPDDVPNIDVQLKVLVQLAADRVAAADYASVTTLSDDAYTTVAASSEFAVAVDQAQYADLDGPCLEALNAKTPVAVPDIAKTMTWPGFRATAADLGLNASVSIPLFAGSGATIAALNLYGRDAAAVAPLIVRVCAVYQSDRYDLDRPLFTDHDRRPPLDPGGEELLAGMAGALTVRSTIQTALGMIMGRGQTGAAEAYLKLRLHAADTGVSLYAAASTMIRTQGR
jgi:hypothetical protein